MTQFNCSTVSRIFCTADGTRVSDIEDLPPQFEGHVDIEDFWQSVDQEIIGRGFLQSNRENPFKVSPSYEKWAPWIGPRTRASKQVLNTEYAKLKAKKSVAEQADIDITEDSCQVN